MLWAWTTFMLWTGKKSFILLRCSLSIDCREMASLSVFVFVLTLSIDVFYHLVCGYLFMSVFCIMRAVWRTQQAFVIEHSTKTEKKKKSPTPLHLWCLCVERISSVVRWYEFRSGSLLCGSIRMLPFYAVSFTCSIVCWIFFIVGFGKRKNYGAALFLLMAASIPIFSVCFFLLLVVSLLLNCIFVFFSFVYLFICLWAWKRVSCGRSYTMNAYK